MTWWLDVFAGAAALAPLMTFVIGSTKHLLNGLHGQATVFVVNPNAVLLLTILALAGIAWLFWRGTVEMFDPTDTLDPTLDDEIVDE